MASSPGTDPIGIELGNDVNSSPPAPSSDSSSSSPPSDPSLSPPSDPSLSPTPPTESSPPPEESPPLSPPPASESPPATPDPPHSSTPPPTTESPPSESHPPPTPPSESQPSSPPDTSSSSPPPSPPTSTTSPPSSTSPSLPNPVLPTTPSSNSSQQTPIVFPPPRSGDNSGGKLPPGGRLSPPSTSNPDAPAPPRHSSGASRPTSSSSDHGSNDSALIIGVVAGGIFILALVVVCLLCSKKKKQPYYSDPGHPPKGGDPYWNSRKPNDHVVKLPTPPGASWGPPPPGGNSSSDVSSPYSGQNHPGYGPPSPNVGGMMGGYNQSQFTYEELAAATGGFSQTNLLGQGGFGYVHKGVLPNGREVAVKSLKSGSGQGEREFQAEVEIISRVHHRHLVSLVGYCISDKQRMLVYEFVPNSTMEFHLHGKGQPVMEWPTRMRIALGSAKGLAYLHEDCNPRIIHRDIKSANILLDDNYEAMVADFGLAKLTTDNYTHVSTRVMGTFGYMAPEYASSGKLTEKSDVFSFGVMLLELITGRRPVDLTNRNMEDGLVDWVRPLIPEALEKDDFSELVDPRLEGNYDHHEMARMIACASACIRHSARRRPKMSQIIRALDGNSSLDDLNEVPKKSPSNISNITRGNETSAYDTGMYNADMMKFRKMVLNSQEYNPNEDGNTSEYGLNPSASSSDEFGSKQQKP